jgi:hypothetical protein
MSFRSPQRPYWLSCRQYYKSIDPAPKHGFTGVGITTDIRYDDLTGLQCANVSTNKPFAYRPHPAGKWLDRNGDAWARWYDGLNITFYDAHDDEEEKDETMDDGDGHTYHLLHDRHNLHHNSPGYALIT